MVMAAGGVCIALGLVVLAGWHTGSTYLVQLSSSSAPMEYHSAWGFALCGVGLLSIALGWPPRVAMLSGGVVAVFGLLTLIQGLLGLSLGIGPFFMQSSILTEVSHPDRRNMSTVLCFALAGTALLMSNQARPERRRLMSWLSGSIITALGLVALLGYLIGIEAGEHWEISRVSIHTGIGLAVLGLGLIALAWREGTAGVAGLPRWLPISIGIGGITATLVLWQALTEEERDQTEQAVEAETEGVKNEIIARIESRISPLLRMAERWQYGGQPSREDWEFAAGLNLMDFKGYRSIQWVDSSFQVRWIVPLEGNENILGMNSAFEGQRRIALGQAR